MNNNNHPDRSQWNAELVEQGNGLPPRGLYVAGDDGELYEVIAVDSTIHTGQSPGMGNWCRANVKIADWSDVEEDDIFPALARV